MKVTHAPKVWTVTKSDSGWRLVRVGTQGPAGPAGDTGATGEGVPAGGVAGAVLQKIDGVDFNTQWFPIFTTANTWTAAQTIPTLIGPVAVRNAADTATVLSVSDTGTLTVQVTDPAQPAAVFQMAVGQTGPAVQIKDGVGTARYYIDHQGGLHFNNSVGSEIKLGFNPSNGTQFEWTGVPGFSVSDGWGVFAAEGSQMMLGAAFGSLPGFKVSVTGNVGNPSQVCFYIERPTGRLALGEGRVSPAAQMHVTNTQAVGVPSFIAQNAAGQTANGFENRDSADVVQFAVGPAGQLKTNQTAAAAGTLGGVTNKLPVYSAAGVLVGYAPLYDSIT